MDLDGYEFIRRTIGEYPVYPGHAVTVGLLIMEAFPSFEEAARRDGPTGYSSALTSSKIPGSGGSVATALEILHRVKTSKYDADKAIEHADDSWCHVDDQESRNPDRWRQGQEQADKLKDRYRAKLRLWAGNLEALAQTCLTEGKKDLELAVALEDQAQMFELGPLRVTLYNLADRIRNLP